MNYFEVNFRNQWEVVQAFDVVARYGSNGYQVRFAKPRLGANAPPAPLVRWNGRESVSANWSFWAPEAAGVVEVVFTL